MGKIKARIIEPTPDFEEGGTYRIESVEEVVTEKRGYKALRVAGVDVGSGEEAVCMLWLSDEVSSDSKLGAFLTVLGDDTDNWNGKVVKCVRWREKERVLTEIVEKLNKTGK